MNTVDSFDYVFKFGKYKGKTFRDVYWLNPGYLLWAHENVRWFTLSDEMLSRVKQGIKDLKNARNQTGPDPATEYALEVYGSDIMY